ncbi:MAG TPA: cytochrome c, partial [Desulfuromonadales bacterium]|nr:cytochrome c [Desulfuromonadales bacterium]
LLLTLSAHFSLLGVLLGATSAALILDTFGRLDRRRHWRALAVELVVRTMPGRGTALLLTLTAALLLLGVQLGYPPLVAAGVFWGLTLAPLFLGLVALTVYRRLLPHEESGLMLASGLGAAGVLLGLLSCFLLCCGAGLLVLPEKWPFLAADPRLLLSWVGTARYLEFTCLSLVATGILILLPVRSPVAGDGKTAEYIRFRRRIGAGLALVFLLGWPCALLLGLVNLPTIALSGAVLAVSGAALAMAAGLALQLLGVLERPEGRSGRPILLLFLILFVLWLLGDHLARESALSEESLPGLAAVVVSPMAPAAGEVGEKEDAAEGKAVFERVCTTCHRFDEKLVGPPLVSVVPKYRGQTEELKTFIRNPVKKDPAYPAMPKLQLSEAEIDAVARYLLERVAP